MIGSIIWNIVIGAGAGLLSFALALMNDNLLLTATIRGVISFGILFVMTFLFRWLLALVMMDVQVSGPDDEADAAEIGRHIDIETPDEDIELPDPASVKAGESDQPERKKQAEQPGQQADPAVFFQAFQPPRITLKEEERERPAIDPETAAQVVRRLTED